MKFIIFFVVIYSLILDSMQFYIILPDGEEYVVGDYIRHRRDTSIDVQGQGSKATGLTLGHGGSVDLGGGSHSINGGGLVHKTVGGPTSVGGEIGYSHNPSGTSVKATAMQTPSWGKDVSVQVNKNLYNQGGARLDAFAGAQQHLGGIPGNQRPQGQVGIKFEYRPPAPAQLPPDVLTHICRMTRPAHSCN